MNIEADRQYSYYLFQVQSDLNKYFSYSILWIALVSELFALCALFLRRRLDVENTTIIYLFKWQYSLGFLYVVNAIANTQDFTYPLYNYFPGYNFPSVGCKLRNFLEKFIYCLSPWMQVVSLSNL